MSNYDPADTIWNLLDIAWLCVMRAHAVCEDGKRFDARAIARAEKAIQDAKSERHRALKSDLIEPGDAR